MANHLTIFIDAPSTEKRCAACKGIKPLTAFLPSQASLDGTTERCKDCIWAASEIARQHREARQRRIALPDSSR